MRGNCGEMYFMRQEYNFNNKKFRYYNSRKRLFIFVNPLLVVSADDDLYSIYQYLNVSVKTNLT